MYRFIGPYSTNRACSTNSSSPILPGDLGLAPRNADTGRRMGRVGTFNRLEEKYAYLTNI